MRDADENGKNETGKRESAEQRCESFKGSLLKAEKIRQKIEDARVILDVIMMARQEENNALMKAMHKEKNRGRRRTWPMKVLDKIRMTSCSSRSRTR